MSKPICRSAFLRAVVLTGIAVVTFAGWSPVSAKSVAQTMPMSVTFRHKDPISIPLKGKTKIDFSAPSAKKPGVLCVKFQAFMPMDVTGGWANYLKLTLNGKTLGAKTKTGTDRLLNRGKNYTTVTKETSPWWSKDTLVVFFGPETQLDKRIKTPRAEGYWYVLNISDAATLTKGAKNHLVIENLYPGGSTCKKMLVKDLTVGFATPKK